MSQADSPAPDDSTPYLCLIEMFEVHAARLQKAQLWGPTLKVAGKCIIHKLILPLLQSTTATQPMVKRIAMACSPT
jgi:hypothetical protein